MTMTGVELGELQIFHTKKYGEPLAKFFWELIGVGKRSSGAGFEMQVCLDTGFY